MSPIPRSWSIEPADRGVYFEVPATGVDGVFHLTMAEAVSAGIALISAAELARGSDAVAGADAPRPDSERIDVLLGPRHELRDLRDKVGRRSIAAHFADMERPAVQASEESGRWSLRVDPVVASRGGNSRLFLPALEIDTASAAREWVDLLARLYMLASDSIQLRDVYVQLGENVIRVGRERSGHAPQPGLRPLGKKIGDDSDV